MQDVRQQDHIRVLAETVLVVVASRTVIRSLSPSPAMTRRAMSVTPGRSISSQVSPGQARQNAMLWVPAPPPTSSRTAASSRCSEAGSDPALLELYSCMPRMKSSR